MRRFENKINELSSLISAINDLETLSEPKKRLIGFLKGVLKDKGKKEEKGGYKDVQ